MPGDRPVRILLHGIEGRMGRVVLAMAESMPDRTVVAAGMDWVLPTGPRSCPVFPDAALFQASGIAVDVVIDFSHPSLLAALLAMCTDLSLPVVVATTGLSPEHVRMVDEAAAAIPILRSANLSLGINLMKSLSVRAARLLAEDFDIEIVEAHHRRKLDAPSGTALLLADAIRDSLGGDIPYVLDRHAERRPRDRREIGIQAVRGGGIVGEHTVMFAGEEEILEIRHAALTRDVFARGALQAARFLAGKPAGLYSMDDLVRELSDRD